MHFNLKENFSVSVSSSEKRYNDPTYCMQLQFLAVQTLTVTPEKGYAKIDVFKIIISLQFINNLDLRPDI